MPLTLRELTADELPASWALGRMAFGGPAEAPARALRVVPGMTRLGAFDERGTLVGKVVDVAHEQWWGGRRVVAADVSGVAVRPETRGGGVARQLLTELLVRARERGAAVSALYPTVSAVYRSLGWEVAGSLGATELDTAALPRTRAVDGLTVRPGEPDELPLVTELYERVARQRQGLLTRRGGHFDEAPDTPLPEGVDALSLVFDGDLLVGALVFGRGTGYGVESKLDVHHLLATTPDAARALVGVLAGWTTVTRAVRVPLLAGDVFSTVLPLERASAGSARAWMHRPVDVVRAVADRGWPAHATGRVAFRLRDDVAPWNAGDWELEVADGAATLRRAATEPDLWLDVRGFAVLYCAATGGRALAQTGLAGGSGDPAALDLLACGPRAELLDYF
ncbi:GNAT family N-acetyltransferase [Geodermatophilaceae bacterium NBWT11]|nr:GNAT family N-acetyltransferase [Geodermatophilaceae bacterium NBWT11]